MEMGGWVQIALGFVWVFLEKYLKIDVLIFWSSIPCVFCVYLECSVHISDGFPKKKQFG